VEKPLDAARAGDRRALSKLLSAVENGVESRESLGIPYNSGEGKVIGITGAPGVGKSCLVDQLLRVYSSAGLRIAVLAVDPSSPLTGGALLGDRVRMQSADDDPNVFVRSLATRNQPGGLPVRLGLMAEVLVTSGFDLVLVETVGSGQSEVRIVSVADRVLLVEGPASGDSVQAEKAGVLDLADAIVVNKSDLDGAERVAADLRSALEITGNPPPVVLASARNGDGIEELADLLLKLPIRSDSSMARWRERLLTAWDAALLSHPDLDDVLAALESGMFDADQWVKEKLEGSN
jgi:LAO/AO transport system kinase